MKRKRSDSTNVGLKHQETAPKRTQSLDHALLQAAASGNFVRIESLIQEGANPNAVDDKRRTPLIAAAMMNHLTKTALLLLDHGANPSVTGLDGKSPLYWGMRHGDMEFVRLLITRGAKLEMVNNEGKTLLDLAIEEKNTNIIPLLLAAGAIWPVNHPFPRHLSKADFTKERRLILSYPETHIATAEKSGEVVTYPACLEAFKTCIQRKLGVIPALTPEQQNFFAKTAQLAITEIEKIPVNEGAESLLNSALQPFRTPMDRSHLKRNVHNSTLDGEKTQNDRIPTIKQPFRFGR
jgi:hypothetical protein